ncbi:hypothetical protein niasHT_008575 [Heterodera trifolii]|uniref:Uncharacterized protein n=1 Tax=Heterodera trifolii TaxID=157864 RepID=A0ABD2M9Y9_9BILA
MSSACPFHQNCRVRLPPADEFVPADVTAGGTSATAACGVIASGNATLTFAAHPLASDPHASGGGGYARRLTSPLRAFGRRLRQQSTTSRTVDDLFADEDANSAAGDAAGTNTPKRKPSSTGTAATTASAGTADFEQSTLRQRLLTTRIQWSKDLTIVPADDEAEMKPKQQKLARIEWTSEEEEEDEEKPSSGDEAEAENSEEEEYVQKQQAKVEAVHRDRNEEEEEEEEPDDTQFASHPSDEALLKAPEALPSKAGGPTRMSKSRSLQEMIRHYWSFARSHGTTSAITTTTTANGGIGTPNRKESLSQRRRSRLCAATAVGTSAAAGSAMPRARSTDERLFAALASHTQQLVMPQFLYLRSSHSSVFQARRFSVQITPISLKLLKCIIVAGPFPIGECQFPSQNVLPAIPLVNFLDLLFDHLHPTRQMRLKQPTKDKQQQQQKGSSRQNLFMHPSRNRKQRESPGNHCQRSKRFLPSLFSSRGNNSWHSVAP